MAISLGRLTLFSDKPISHGSFISAAGNFSPALLRLLADSNLLKSSASLRRSRSTPTSDHSPFSWKCIETHMYFFCIYVVCTYNMYDIYIYIYIHAYLFIYIYIYLFIHMYYKYTSEMSDRLRYTQFCTLNTAASLRASEAPSALEALPVLAMTSRGIQGETMEHRGIFSMKHGEAIGKIWKNSGSFNL